MLWTTLWASPSHADRVRFCFLFCEIESTSSAGGFDALYQPIIRSPADAAQIKGLKDPVRKRVEANEILWRCNKGFDHPICKGVKQK